MAEIKPLKSISEKWTRVTPGRSEDYKLGIQNPRRDWATATTAGEANYAAGVQAAQAKGMFKKGVTKAGSQKWKDKSMAKGPGRFSEGVFASGGDYEKGFAPYRDAIEKANLGPRFPKRDPRNIGRVTAVVNALIAAKTGA